jgi:hypothetical protein
MTKRSALFTPLSAGAPLSGADELQSVCTRTLSAPVWRLFFGESKRRSREFSRRVQSLEDIAARAAPAVALPAHAEVRVEARGETRKLASPSNWFLFSRAIEDVFGSTLMEKQVDIHSAYCQEAIKRVEIGFRDAGAPQRPQYFSFTITTFHQDPTGTGTEAGIIDLGHSAATAKSYSYSFTQTYGQLPEFFLQEL